MATENKRESAIQGRAHVAGKWVVFGPYSGDYFRVQPEDWPVPLAEELTAIPKRLSQSGVERLPLEMVPLRSQLKLAELLDSRREDAGPPQSRLPESTPLGAAFIYIPVSSETDQECVSFGVAGFQWYQVWLNGKLITQRQKGETAWPPSIHGHRFEVPLKAGKNLFVIRLIGSRGGVMGGGSVVAFGGPDELRGDCRSIMNDPFENDPLWMDQQPHAQAGGKSAVDIASRRELLVDDFMIDGVSGPLKLRLNPAIPREVVMHMDQPWEGPTNAYYNLVDAGDGRSLLYYSSRPKSGLGDYSDEQFCCVAETTDGIHFSRPNLGLVDFNGSTANNIIIAGKSGHNFTVFRDSRPGVEGDQAFKAVAFHPQAKGLAAFCSGDGLHWRLLTEERIITAGSFDSQNLAFWDSVRGCYVCYLRDNSTGVRRIMYALSDDFLTWSEPQPLEYSDGRNDHMYTNAIQLYPAASHLYIGFPARFVLDRTKFCDAPACGISDGLFISSRDGTHFNRWVSPLVRPVAEPRVWTDRNNYPASGIHQTAPDTLSLYWSEHYKHPTNRLRRGTVRTDGFTCMCEEGQGVGELLTRPFTFSGDRLVVNYTTSAIGSIRFGLCDAEGNSLPGLDMRESEVLFGNEINHAVKWIDGPDLAKWAGQPVRLRIRMFDAELYAFQFAQGTAL